MLCNYQCIENELSGIMSVLTPKHFVKTYVEPPTVDTQIIFPQRVLVLLKTYSHVRNREETLKLWLKLMLLAQTVNNLASAATTAAPPSSQITSSNPCRICGVL